jgi:predicted Zn-dependent protease
MSAATIFAQVAGGSLASVGGLPIRLRVANALASYLSYLTKTFWPTGLAYFYPYSLDLPLATVLGAGLLLAIWTVWFVLRVRSQPVLLVGWLWFLGTLVPTIGLVQFCIQAKADRYTYIPSIGLFMALAWGLQDLFERWPARRKSLPVLAGVALAGCLAASSVQLSYWQNSLTVSRHALEVTDNNYVAYESHGEAIAALGQPESALYFFAEAVRLSPGWPQGQFNLGITLSKIGHTNDAIEHLREGVKLVPDYPEGRSLLGQTLLRYGETDEAIHEFAEVVQLEPHSAEARCRLANALEQRGKFSEAALQYREALRQTGGFPKAKTALDQMLSMHPDLK